MTGYQSSAPLVFIHVPKTAGGSVRAVIRNWFGAGFIPHYFDEGRQALPQRDPRADHPSPDQPLCIYGHFNRDRGFGVERNYPDQRQFITILRDPLEMTISRYYYARKMNRGGALIRGPLLEFLRKTELNMLNHFPRPVTAENYKDIIEEYFLEIGFTEMLPASLQRIAARLGLRFETQMLPLHNQSPRDAEAALPPAFRAAFEEAHPLGYAVYRYAQAKFHPHPVP